MKLLLKEFIQEALLIEKVVPDRADKRIDNNISTKIFKAMGVETIPRGDNLEGKLGAGRFGVAYEVIWNGKRVVAKITDDKDELTSARKINVIKKGVPENIGKHLPTFLKFQTIVTGRDTEDEAEYYVIMVEYLNPLPSSIKALVFVDESSNDFKNAIVTNMKSAIENENELKDEIRQIVDKGYVNNVFGQGLNKNESKHKLMLTNAAFSLTKEFLKRKLEKNRDTSKSSDLKAESGWDIVNPEIYRIWSKIAATDENIDFDVKYVNDEIKNLFFSDKNVFPTFHDDVKGEPEFKDKRVQELYDAMTWLKEKNITKWQDLHRYNVMMRNDKTLVASDVGMFHYPRQSQRKQSKN